MVTLANVQGGSLAPDVSGSLDVLLKTFGTKQSRDKEKKAEEEKRKRQAGIEEQVDVLGSEDASQDKIQAALLKLTSLDPQVGAGARQVLERGDKQELLVAQQATREGMQNAFIVSSEKTHAGKLNALSNIAKENALNGKDNTRILELSNLSPEMLDLKLQKMQLQGEILDSAIKEKLKPAPETFETVLDEAGQPIAQRSLRTGKEIASPRKPVAPKVEQRTSLAKNLELAGIDPLSAEGQKMIRDSITKPGVKIDLNKGLDFKVPVGFRPVKDPETGKFTALEPVPGGGKDNLKGENAAKAQMLRTALKAAEGIRGLIFEKDGTLDRTNLFNSTFGTPGTQGRELANKIEFGIQAITRGETGAAMPQEELDNTRTRFQPSLFDSVETAQLKIDMFFDFLNGTLDLIDPTGRLNDEGVRTGKLNVEKFDAELKRRGGTPTVRELPAFDDPLGRNEAAQTDQPIVVDF